MSTHRARWGMLLTVAVLLVGCGEGATDVVQEAGTTTSASAPAPSSTSTTGTASPGAPGLTASVDDPVLVPGRSFAFAASGCTAEAFGTPDLFFDVLLRPDGAAAATSILGGDARAVMARPEGTVEGSVPVPADLAGGPAELVVACMQDRGSAAPRQMATSEPIAVTVAPLPALELASSTVPAAGALRVRPDCSRGTRPEYVAVFVTLAPADGSQPTQVSDGLYGADADGWVTLELPATLAAGTYEATAWCQVQRDTRHIPFQPFTVTVTG